MRKESLESLSRFLPVAVLKDRGQALGSAHAVAGADRQHAAKELLSGEIPEGQTFRGTPVPDAPASLKRGRTFESRNQSLG